VDAVGVLDELGLTGAGHAAPVTGGDGAGFHADDLVMPASVMKIQIALAIENAIAAGSLDGSARRVMSSAHRTPGPVGISLMRDEVSMSVRDLVVAMLTISDNVATDELISVIGLDAVNRTTRGLGMSRTHIKSDLRDMLDALAHEVGFPAYSALAAHDPELGSPPSADEIRSGLAASATLDPARGTRTTAAETVMLLQAIWTDRAGPPQACTSIRDAMAAQVTPHRIASGFGSSVAVAAKSGGLMGIVRNEVGVVTFPDGAAYAVSVFTRKNMRATCDPATVDAGIGRIARALIERLRSA
jgi:beta-lactamase class A